MTAHPEVKTAEFNSDVYIDSFRNVEYVENYILLNKPIILQTEPERKIYASQEFRALSKTPDDRLSPRE